MSVSAKVEKPDLKADKMSIRFIFNWRNSSHFVSLRRKAMFYAPTVLAVWIWVGLRV